MCARIASALGLAGVFVAAAAAAAWFAAAPRRISAEVAAAVSEPGDPEAGKNVFYIAGCESCHHVARAERSASSRRRPGAEDAVRLVLPAQHLPDRRDGIGGWTAEISPTR